MKVTSINNNDNINFNAKLKPLKHLKTKANGKIVTPVIMSALTAQLLKEQVLASASDTMQYNGYLNKDLSKAEVSRGEKLANCFKFYKEQEQVLYNIMMIMVNQRLNINDTFFIREFFDFIESDISLEAKMSAFNTLSKENNSKFLQTVLVNFATFKDESDEIQARFSISDLMNLQDIYNASNNKELILDMVKEGIVIDDNGLKAYRFDMDEIFNLGECYINAPNKQLLLTLINQYEYDETIDENCPLYSASMIISLVNNCISKKKAAFLTQICSEKIIIDGKNVNRFGGQATFVFNKIYDEYPEELMFLINETITDNNGKKYPRFNADEITKLMLAYKKLGQPVMELVKRTDTNKELDTPTILYLTNQLMSKQGHILKEKLS